MIHRFNGKETAAVLLDSPYILAMLDTNGFPIWHGLGRADYPSNDGSAGQTTSIKHALVDFAGDGMFQIASAGYGDGVRAIDPRDGKVLWSLAAPVPTCPRVVAVDIDGRKGDELLYAAGSKLVAITGDRSAGRLLWEWQGPANLFAARHRRPRRRWCGANHRASRRWNRSYCQKGAIEGPMHQEWLSEGMARTLYDVGRKS